MLTEPQITDEVVLSVAKQMAAAARTAPKGKGTNNLVIAIAEPKDIKIIAEKMKEIGENSGSFARDAGNILEAPAMLILGTKISPMGVGHCGMCGFGDCKGKLEHPEVPCVFNTGDLGIAIGSAVSVAMDHRIDNRVMYTAGQAIKAMPDVFTEFKDTPVLYTIPLSAKSKNVFFDRK